MASASSFYSIAKDVAEKWGELETTANRLMTDELSKGYKKGLKNWLLSQSLNKKDFRKLMSKLAQDKLDEINKASKEALDIAKDFTDEETKRALKVLANIDEELEDDKEFINTSFKKWADENEGFVKAFVSSSYKKFENSIKKIESNARSEFKKSYRVSDDTKILYDKIMQQTKDNIKDGINITYSNGRQVSFKVYMEMKTRTTLQEIMTEKMQSSSNALGIIFFLATERFDSADDHADYQGKVYVSKNWQSKVKDDELKNRIKAFIKNNDIMTVEYIKGPPVYFTTRPNCRHSLMPITNEQALGNIAELKQTLRTKQGTYKEDNYKDLKQQRQNERNLRFYKDRLENSTILYKNATDPNIKAKLEQQIAKEKGLVGFWRQRQLKLIRNNPNLRREYSRENVNKMASDLGVSVKLKNDMKKTKEQL